MMLMNFRGGQSTMSSHKQWITIIIVIIEARVLWALWYGNLGYLDRKSANDFTTHISRHNMYSSTLWGSGVQENGISDTLFQPLAAFGSLWLLDTQYTKIRDC